jgi:glycosyltransferase involved in cell wall biosynthesis
MARPDLAMMMFDLKASGVVKNALRISGAAAEAGLRTELWVASDEGDMRDQVPAAVSVRNLGVQVAADYSRRERKTAARQAVPALAREFNEVRPRIACSAGNHFHDAAARARRMVASSDLRLIARFSNALPRFSWSPVRLPESLWKRLAARRRLAAFDRIVAVSSELAIDLEQQLRIRPEKICVIPNGIDLADTERRSAEPVGHPWFQSGGPPVVLGVGRLVPQKNIDGLIRAFARAREVMPMRLMILGDGVERAKLEQLARDLGVEADVDLVGQVTNPLPYYARAGLFVLPSHWEGMSNALLEALAVGCPVLATRCSGSMELLSATMPERLVPVGDANALSDGIVTHLNSSTGPERFRGLVAAYELKRTLAAYVSLFEGELSRS